VLLAVADAADDGVAGDGRIADEAFFDGSAAVGDVGAGRILGFVGASSITRRRCR